VETDCHLECVDGQGERLRNDQLVERDLLDRPAHGGVGLQSIVFWCGNVCELGEWIGREDWFDGGGSGSGWQLRGEENVSQICDKNGKSGFFYNC